MAVSYTSGGRAVSERYSTVQRYPLPWPGIDNAGPHGLDSGAKHEQGDDRCHYQEGKDNAVLGGSLAVFIRHQHSVVPCPITHPIRAMSSPF